MDVAGLRRALLAGQHLDADGLAGWASELVGTALLTVGLRADVRSVALPAHAEWSVEVRVSGRVAVLLDIATDALGQSSLDRLELRAARTWRSVTRNAASFEPRPWLGAVRIGKHRIHDVRGVQRLEQLVASRMLDAACVVEVDEPADDVWSPSPATSIESFQSALIGRCLVLSTLKEPV